MPMKKCPGRNALALHNLRLITYFSYANIIGANRKLVANYISRTLFHVVFVANYTHAHFFRHVRTRCVVGVGTQQNKTQNHESFPSTEQNAKSRIDFHDTTRVHLGYLQTRKAQNRNNELNTVITFVEACFTLGLTND